MATYAIKQLGLRPEEVAAVLGSKQLKTDLEAAGWLSPVIRRHKLTLYDASEVNRAWARLLAGEIPQVNKGRKSGSPSGEEPRKTKETLTAPND
jgi:hypothetical protein